MRRRRKKTERIATLSGVELLLTASLGHQQHASGSGPHRATKRDKKLERQRGKRACQDWR